MKRPVKVLIVTPDEEKAHELGDTLANNIRVDFDIDTDLSIMSNGIGEYDLIVLDRDSDPDLKGMKRLRQRFSDKEMPIILLDDQDSEVESIRAGANAFCDSETTDPMQLGHLTYVFGHKGKDGV